MLVGAGTARASVARAVAVSALVGRSKSILVGMPLSAYSEWAEVGGSRRIVTVTRVRVDEHVARAKPDAELLVRTLGGRVGKIGQLVHGEAELRTGTPAMLFVQDDGQGLSSVTAMAQGHYPLVVERGARMLRASPGLPKLVMGADAAVERLAGKSLDVAARIVREADKP